SNPLAGRLAGNNAHGPRRSLLPAPGGFCAPGYPGGPGHFGVGKRRAFWSNSLVRSIAFRAPAYAHMSIYDGILLGTGHNALVFTAYLSRCGLKTISLDRATTPGGGLMTIDNPRLPGFRHNPHSFFHRALTKMPWYRDLELEQYGVRYLEPK